MNKETTNQETSSVDILDILLDEENIKPIELYDEKGKKIVFEQIAIIPYDDKIYAILKPVEALDGIADDEAIVFRVDETEEGEHILLVETDENLAINVFDEYYNLLEEDQKAQKETKKETKKPAKK